MYKYFRYVNLNVDGFCVHIYLGFVFILQDTGAEPYGAVSTRERDRGRARWGATTSDNAEQGDGIECALRKG